MLPLGTDSPLHSKPWMNWLLIAANVAVMIWQSMDPRLMLRLELSVQSLELPHFLSYAFMHIGWLHLLANMVVLYALGNNINDRLGHGGYLGFYLGGAVFAGIGFIASGGQATVGASGAVGAVMGAFLVLLPRSNIIVSLRWVWLEVPCMYFIIIYFIYNLVMSFTLQAAVQQVAYEAHIAGMVFGFVVAIGLLASGLLPRQQFDFLALAQRWNRRRSYRNLVKQGFDPFRYVEPQAARQPEIQAPRPEADMLRAEVLMAVGRRELPRAAMLYRRLRSVDPGQVLPRDTQLDIANQLASEQLFAEAAEAYEQLLERYPAFDRIGDVKLMLGVIYARYLGRYARARECLAASIGRLQDESRIRMAREELARVEALLPPPSEPAAKADHPAA